MSLFLKVFLLAFILLTFPLICQKMNCNISKPHKNNLRVMMFRKPRQASDFDPVKIHFAPEYLFLENIYSPLVEYSPDGKLVSGVAESFIWAGSEAHFKIRDDLFTVDGYKITAYDVEKSLKRLFILGTNTHGNLKDAVCGNFDLKDINGYCPGMEVRDNGRLFVLKFPKKNPSLFQMLTAIDFAVIPSIAIDDKTLKIKDYRNTSGPYYVEGDGINLKANCRHYHYSKLMPQEIVYVYPEPGEDYDPIKAFSENRHDHITTIGNVSSMILSYARQHTGVNFHSTYPFRLDLLSFTVKGRKRFDEKERFEIGGLVRKVIMPRYLIREGYETAEQILPVFGEGTLSVEQISELKNKTASFKPPEKIDNKMIAWNFPLQCVPELKKHFPNTEFIMGPGIPVFVDYKKEGVAEPDFYFSITDMSFQEDINLISYSLNMDLFKVSGNEARNWMKKYMETEDKAARIKMLNKMQYETLMEGDVFPLVFSPYAAIVRKPWKFGLSKYYANDPLWRIYRE